MSPSDGDAWLVGGGEMGALIRSVDWSTTSLGPMHTWPQSLRTAVSIGLGSRHPIVLWWGSERTMFYNDAYRPMLGESKHPQFLGQPGQACWAEIWDIIGPMMDHVIATGEATWSEDLFLLMLRYGYLEETYFTFSYSPIRDELGQPRGIFNACTESTARVLSDRRLRTLREMAVEVRIADDAVRHCADTLGRNLRDIPFALIYLTDEQGKRLHLAGHTGLEAGTPASPLAVEIADAEEAGWPLARVAIRGHAEIVANLGDRFDCLPTAPWDAPPHVAMVMPIARPGSPQAAGVLVLGTSPRRAFDDDYRGFFGLLAGQVSTVIGNARAYEAERRRAEALAEVDRAKTEFFSNVSHEFRTPLTLLLGPAEELLADGDQPLSDRQRESVELIHRNAQRLLKLVNTLLDFSRIEAGRVRAVFAPTDLARLTIDLTTVFGSAMEKAGLRLVVDCPQLAEPVYVDREMWEKVVLNLISNAFKFTFEGVIEVSLRAQDGGHQLRVRDTGIGIASDQLPHVFERFHRVRGARARSHEGTGIGLSLVQELVRLHGGTVAVESEPGAGSCFTVTIPRGKDHLPSEVISTTHDDVAPWRREVYRDEALHWLPLSGSDTPSPAVPPPIDPSSAPPDDTRVLFVDDNADLRAYVTSLLAPHCIVETAPDGAVGLARALETRPDLVLSDVMMPNLDGFGLLRALRADPRTRTTPVILLSARAGEEAAVEGLDATADDYLAKPFSARELIARVRTHAALSRARREWSMRLAQATAEALLQQERAEAANLAKSSFLAGMSHELRTPLNAILGFTELIHDGVVNPEQPEFREFLGDILTSGQHLLELINDVLDLSKVEAGKLQFHPEQVDVGVLIREVVGILRTTAAAASVHVDVEIGPDLADVVLDPARLKQVLYNYVSNALHFTPESGHVIVRACGEGASAWRLEVTDTGSGIAPENLGRLFAEFQQLDDGGAKKYAGTGLGLALTRRLVEAQGGTVGVRSTPGQGSTFHAVLPRHAASGAAMPALRSVSGATADAPAP